MDSPRAFQTAAVLWAMYALLTALPVISYPALLLPALIRAALGLLIAWRLWARPGRGIAIVATLLSFGSLPLAFLAFTNASQVGALYLAVALVGLLCLIASAYCWRIAQRARSRVS